MKNTKLKKTKARKYRSRIDPDHFTVFELKEGWENRISKHWSQKEIEFFKERQDLFRQIPEEIRIRTKRDESYREGWIDAAEWIHKQMDKIFHPRRSGDEKSDN